MKPETCHGKILHQFEYQQPIIYWNDFIENEAANLEKHFPLPENMEYRFAILFERKSIMLFAGDKGKEISVLDLVAGNQSK